MRVPDTFLILLALALLAYLATWLVVPGQFATTGGDSPRIIAGSFRAAAAPAPVPLFGSEGEVGLLGFLFEGLVSGSRSSATVGLMAFLLVVGGAFGVVMRTGAIERILVAGLAGKPESAVIVPLLFLAFSLGGAVFGMGEEAIAFSLILVPALVRAGYDSITALLCCYVATQVGFATSWMNPFSVVVAQSVAGVPILSGLPFRVAMFALFTLIGAAYAWRYAVRVRAAPERSIAYGSDAIFRAATDASAIGPARRSDWLILSIVLATTVWVGWGVVARGYYLAEIAAQFFAMALLCGLVARLLRMDGSDGNALVGSFRDGAAQMVPAVLVVAAAKGILLILGGDDPAQPTLLNTLLDAMSKLTLALPEWATAWGMLLFQSVINLFIVSGSGQAAITMPLMAPLADLSGVTRQTAVLAFQLGDGITNIVVPTSAALMGCLAAARLDFTRWIAFAWRPMLALFGLESLAVLIAHMIGYA